MSTFLFPHSVLQANTIRSVCFLELFYETDDKKRCALLVAYETLRESSR